MNKLLRTLRLVVASAGVSALLRHMRRRWYLCFPVLGVWTLACVRLFIDPTPRVPLLVNWTPSLPYRVALMRPIRQPLHRGDLVVYRFDGEAKTDHPGLAGQPFFKVIRGLAGDVVSVQGQLVRVNDEVVGVAKTHAFDRRPLDPITPQVIPPGHYYVQGTSPDSFDSRYRASGLVREDQIVCSVFPLF